MCDGDVVCTHHADCPSGFCLTPTASPTGPGVCAQVCGRSSNCGGRTQCWEANERRGIRACQSAAHLIATYADPTRTIGLLAPGDVCVGSRDCLSGMCLLTSGGEKRCTTACSRDTDCLGGSHCRVVDDTLPLRYVEACVEDASYPLDTDAYPGFCSPRSASLMCTYDGSWIFSPCCSSPSCPALPSSNATYPSTCLPMLPIIQVVQTPQSVTLMNGCMPQTSVGVGGVGASCVLGNPPPAPGCRSNVCIDELADGAATTPYCTDVCCADADCPSGYGCFPTQVDAVYSAAVCKKR